MSSWKFFAGFRTEVPPDECLDRMARLDTLYRCGIYTSLAFERLLRKAEDLKRIFEESDSNWNTALYRMLFRTMSDPKNRECYREVAARVPYDRILRERPSILRIEAMLFGASGLLEGCRDDAYTADLREEFGHLAGKYGIEPLEPGAWQLKGIRPFNHPRLRLAQLAAFLVRNDFVIDRVLACRTAEEVRNLFGVEASQYWSSYYNPSSAADRSTKRVGHEKADMIGINLVAVLQFLYGEVYGMEELRRAAVNLWEALPAENNRYTKRWKEAGIVPASAFESQAQLQLSTEYCTQKRCGECPFRALLRKMRF